MRVLALVNEAFGGRGGIAQYNRDFVRAMSVSREVTHVVVLPRHADDGVGCPPAVSQRRPRAARMTYAVSVLREVMTSPKFDIVFAGHLNLSPLAALAAHVCRAQLWLQVHGREAWRAPSRIVRYAAGRADLITSVSRHTRQQMIGHWWPGERERVRVLPNTFGNSFRPGPTDGALLARYGLADCKVVLTVGRSAASERYKGHDRVMSLMPRLRMRHPDATYLIVGGGDDEPRLRALAAAHGAGDSVVFAGYVTSDDLPAHYNLADVFVMASTGEGFGITFLEAAACGLPVIGGRHDGSLDALREGRVGRLIDLGGDEALLAELDAALSGARGGNPQSVDVFRRARFEHHVDRLLQDLVAARTNGSRL